MPVELWPVMQHRMAHYRAEARQVGHRRGGPELEQEPDRGGARPRRLHRPRPRRRPARGAKENWGWNWSNTRRVLDYLYTVGELAIAGRNSQFEVLLRPARAGDPAEVLARADPVASADANRELVRRAARSHGVAHRPVPARLLPDAHAKAGRARRSTSWSRRASWCRSRSTAGTARRTSTATRGCPRRVDARALLSPFDPVVWERRAHRAALRLPLPDRDLHARRPSGSTATTCCRSCSATGSSPGST